MSTVSIYALMKQMKTIGKPYIGITQDESFVRGHLYAKTGCNVYTGSTIKSQPLGPWTRPDVLRYIVEHDIEISSAWVFLWKMGIEIFQSQKPDLGNGFEKSGKKAVYYGSLEYKESAEAIKGSRACGVLLTGDTAYVVYNTMAKRMKWAQKMEMAMRTWTERMLLIGGGLRQADSLILGNTMDFLLELLNSDGGVRKNLYQVDDVYEHYYYIPRTDNAKVQMELLLTSWKREKIKNLLATLVKYPRRKQYALSEGFDKDMQLIYFCHELDMRHLCRIKQEIGWKQKGTIICLDYQANVLRAYFGEGVRVRELNTDKIMEYLTKGRDE